MSTHDVPPGGADQALPRAASSDARGLVAWVQPIVALTTGTVAGFEALARFTDRRSPITAIFERAWSIGRGPELEAAALSAALALPGRPPGTYIAANISPRAMESGLVRSVLDRDLAGVMIEITEVHYVATNELKDIAAWLRERGARIAIDDVGTGYAGLERAIVLRPDLIKLDRSLTEQLPHDTVTRVMVESLVRFAAGSGTAVCAEGIESAPLLEVVAELDIAYGQGFLFGAARPGWSTLSSEVAAAAAAVHQQALRGTPKQSLFLNELVLLERLADRFSEADALEDVHHAVAALTHLVGADEVAIELLTAGGEQLSRLSHHTWESSEAVTLDELPLLRWALDTRRAAQVLVTDPDADRPMVERLWAAGCGGVLLVPVTTRGESLGVLSFYRREPTPWSLAQMRLARIGASQLAATLERLLPQPV